METPAQASDCRLLDCRLLDCRLLTAQTHNPQPTTSLTLLDPQQRNPSHQHISSLSASQAKPSPSPCSSSVLPPDHSTLQEDYLINYSPPPPTPSINDPILTSYQQHLSPHPQPTLDPSRHPIRSQTNLVPIPPLPSNTNLSHPPPLPALNPSTLRLRSSMASSWTIVLSA